MMFVAAVAIVQRPAVVNQPAARRAPPVFCAESTQQPRYLSEGSLWPGSQTTVREHMTETLAVLSPEASLREAATLLKDKRISGAPVVADGKLLGIVSRSDLVGRIAAAGDGKEECSVAKLEAIEQEEVQRVMVSPVKTISPDATVLEAAQMMAPERINRLMVTGAGGELLGIITSTDIVNMALTDELSELDYGDIDGE